MKLKQPFFFFALGVILWLLSVIAPPAVAQTNTNTVQIRVGLEGTNSVKSFSARVSELEERAAAISFGLEKVPLLQPPLFGAPRWKYVASLIFIVIAFCCAKFIDLVLGGWLTRWASRTKGRWDDLVLKLVHGPIKVVSFVILLHMGLEALNWPPTVRIWFSKVLRVVVACSITYMAVRLVDVLVEYWRARSAAREDRMLDDHLFPVITKSFKIFILIVAILVTCQNLGLDVTAMLASLSIGGLALGLAAQDTIANLFGAVAVFVDKPFRVGDRVKLDGIDGTVESVGLRSTRIRNLDGFLVTVPNKTMGNATITNVTRRPNIKTEMNIGITYDTSSEKVQRALEILDRIYREHPDTEDLLITFNKFADSALNINVIHWWRGTDHRKYLKGMQGLNIAIKQRFDSEGIDFAFPTQTLYVKQEQESSSVLANQPVQQPK